MDTPLHRSLGPQWASQDQRQLDMSRRFLRTAQERLYHARRHLGHIISIQNDPRRSVSSREWALYWAQQSVKLEELRVKSWLDSVWADQGRKNA